MTALSRENLETHAWFPVAEYPFSSRFTKIDTHTLHSIDEGQGPPVVFVHGTPSWSFEFRHLVAALSSTHRCLALDHLGFGLSDRPDAADYSVAGHAARFAAWMQSLQLPPCTLVVHDFGGPIALPYALTHAQAVKRLVLGNTWFWPFEQVVPSFAKQKPLLNNALMRGMYLRFNFSAKVIVKSAWGKHRPLTAAQHACYHGMFPTRQSRLGTWGFAQGVIHAPDYFTQQPKPQTLAQWPTLIAWGQADSFVPLPHLQHWRALLPQAQILECPKAGHFVFDEAADMVAPKLRAFLGEA